MTVTLVPRPHAHFLNFYTYDMFTSVVIVCTGENEERTWEGTWERTPGNTGKQYCTHTKFNHLCMFCPVLSYALSSKQMFMFVHIWCYCVQMEVKEVEEKCARQLQELKVNLCNLHTQVLWITKLTLFYFVTKALGEGSCASWTFQRRLKATISDVHSDILVSCSYESTQINLKHAEL